MKVQIGAICSLTAMVLNKVNMVPVLTEQSSACMHVFGSDGGDRGGEKSGINRDFPAAVSREYDIVWERAYGKQGL